MSQNENINWELIRSFQNVRVIAKASYLSLVFIPLIAAFWPNINTYLKQFSIPIKKTVEKIDVIKTNFNILEKIKFQDQRILPLKKKIADINGNLSNLKTKISDLVKKLKNSKKLPIVFLYAFIAALATVLAESIYQMRSPDTIKKYSLNDYYEINQYNSNHGGAAIKLNQKTIKIKYINEANLNSKSMYFSFVLYLIAIVSTFCILINQLHRIWLVT